MYNPDSTALHCFLLWSNKQPDLKTAPYHMIQNTFQGYLLNCILLWAYAVQSMLLPWDSCFWKSCFCFPEVLHRGNISGNFDSVSWVPDPYLTVFRSLLFWEKYTSGMDHKPGHTHTLYIQHLTFFSVWSCLLRLVLSLKIQIHSALLLGGYPPKIIVLYFPAICNGKPQKTGIFYDFISFFFL